MDLRLYSRVLWRFRVIVIAGLLVAGILSALTVAKVSVKGGRPALEYRQPQVWSSAARIFVTQQGFALGRAVYTKVIPVGTAANGQQDYVPVLSDPTRFASYATLYASLATSDEVSRLMLRDGPLRGIVSAEAMTVANDARVGLPFVTLSGVSDSPAGAVDTARRAASALTEYVRRQQDTERIPQNQRVVLKVLNRPAGAALVSNRSMTRPIVVFLAVAMAVVALAFVLENLRPRLRPMELEEAGANAPSARRSA